MRTRSTLLNPIVVAGAARAGLSLSSVAVRATNPVRAANERVAESAHRFTVPHDDVLDAIERRRDRRHLMHLMPEQVRRLLRLGVRCPSPRPRVPDSSSPRRGSRSRAHRTRRTTSSGDPGESEPPPAAVAGRGTGR